MSRHMRQADIGVIPHPAVPIASANTARLYFKHDAGLAWRRICDLPDRKRLLELLVNGRSHLYLFRLYFSIATVKARFLSCSFFVNAARSSVAEQVFSCSFR